MVDIYPVVSPTWLVNIPHEYICNMSIGNWLNHDKSLCLILKSPWWLVINLKFRMLIVQYIRISHDLHISWLNFPVSCWQFSILQKVDEIPICCGEYPITISPFYLTKLYPHIIPLFLLNIPIFRQTKWGLSVYPRRNEATAATLGVQ